MDDAISDGLHHFPMPDGSMLSLDLIEASQVINDLVGKHQGARNYEFLTDFIVWVEQNTGHKLRMGQANELWEKIQFEVTAKKKLYYDRLKSLSSTDLIPAD